MMERPNRHVWTRPGAAVYAASFPDGSGALFSPVLPVDLAAAGAGLLIRDVPEGGEAVDLRLVPALRGELARVAVARAASPEVALVVVCPVGVSPYRTAVALAVAEILGASRASGAGVVTCAVAPAHGASLATIRHDVRVRAAGGAVSRCRAFEIVARSAVRGPVSLVRGAA